jgi:hypothetical protein
MLFQLLDSSGSLMSLGFGSHFLWEMYHPIDRTGWASHAVDSSTITPSERRVIDWSISRITGGARYLDKYPRMCLRVAYLQAMFPDAWFVYITRDGRAAVSSLITGWRTPAKFGQGTRLPVPLEIDGYDGPVWKFLVPPGWREYTSGHSLAEVCAFQWSEANRAVLDAKRMVDTERWIDVRYEDIVDHPVATMENILDRLRLHGDQRVLDHAAQLDRRVTQTAVTPPRRDKWRTENPSEVTSILPQIAPMQQRLGYPAD